MLIRIKMDNLIVLYGPDGRFRSREEQIREFIEGDGLGDINEDILASYCTTALTKTPNELKPFLQRRQDVLIERILEPAGISSFDPGKSPTSPDSNPHVRINDIYRKENKAAIASRRFFAGHNLIASTGYGVETEIARSYIRIPVIFMDKSIRVSTMQPDRIIYLQYDNDFAAKADEFVEVFKLLQQYEPAGGLRANDNFPVLLGFHKKTQEKVDMEDLVYKTFPHLQYHYDGNAPIIKLKAMNPEVFYDFRRNAAAKPFNT